MKNLNWRLVLIGAVLVWALIYAWPRAERPILNQKLGLDLKGGSRLLMEVQVDDAVKAQCDVYATRLGDRLRKEGYPDVRTTTLDGGKVQVLGIAPDRTDGAQKIAEEEMQSWLFSTNADGLLLTMPAAQQDTYRDQAVNQALETISNRIDAFGVGETNRQRLGGSQKYRILVELPGVEDPSRVKRIIQTQARLELRLAFYRPDGAGPFQAKSEADVIALLGGQLPPGVEILPFENKSGVESGFMAVERASAITGADLRTASRSQDQWQQPNVSFELKVEAVDRFAKFTRSNINRQMPIVLDNKIKSAPSINSEIGQHGQIQGRFTLQEAEDLALVLRAGALPARVITLEERTVGPSLGKDSIDAGLKASGLGALLVICFMLVYYKGAGINAIVTLAMNMIIVAAAMALLGATLTLPGIGGYALTIGMAVDANVLIFERIREELRAGKTVRAAIDAGFSKAFGTIADSNLTTIIAALFLMQYGTGPVKGFAVSLTIGLLVNMFTAVFVSRTIFELWLGNKPAEKLSI
ncbi:MAG: protein translocase subunit SecD [Acidobacteriota bacterium]